MNEGTRVRELRKELKLTLEKFGDPLGVGKTAISKIENGERGLTDQMIISICREYDVNETWLRTGEGEMFIPMTRDEQIEAFMGDVLRSEAPDFRRRLIAALAKMDEKEWELLEAKLEEIMDKDPDGPQKEGD